MRAFLKKYRAMILGVIFLSGCASVTTPAENNHEKALVLLSDHAQAVILLAGVPVRHYCQSHAWPAAAKLNAEQTELFGLTNVSYHDAVQGEYGISFDLTSAVPQDFFVSHWMMRVAAPNLAVSREQSLALTLMNEDSNIELHSSLMIDCKVAEAV
jgi:hypothetical protein